MKITQDKAVTIIYDLHVGEEESSLTLVESVDEEQAFAYIHGNSGLPEGFENKMEGLEEGETFKFSLESSEAYGEPSEDNIIGVPKSAFEMDGQIEEGLLEEGNFIPMTDDRGYQVQGKVLEVQNDNVLMDFNHPLTGMKLHFEGKVIEVRDASEEEIESGQVLED